MRTWHPTGTRTHWGAPPVGALFAQDHAVWRVAAVVDVPLSDADRDVWLDAGMPDPATWRGRPYRIDVEYVAGARPDWAPAGQPVPPAQADIPADRFVRRDWNLYPPSGRWPKCSCCGEPMPCRAELQDREVSAGLEQVEKLAGRMPGCCWGCGEPITSRHKTATYPGDNLDLPGGQPVRFHTRRQCWHTAVRYELRWLAVDPRRERILTYPKCDGILVVHADGSSECRSGRGALGTDHTTEPDCQGHLTHDHGTHAACYVGDAWLAPPTEMNGCSRGCSQDNHPGTRTTPRPARTLAAALEGTT